MTDKPWKCGACGWVMPLGPGVEQTWCPCGWRKGQVLQIVQQEVQQEVQQDEAA